MLRFVGCDVHKRTAVFTLLLEDGTLFARYTVPVTREALTAFAERQLVGEDRLAMEATTNTWAVAGVLRPFVKEVVIGNPLRVRAIAEAKIKTDKVDSRVLAELLRCDYLPKVWQPDPETQRLRRLTHRRGAPGGGPPPVEKNLSPPFFPTPGTPPGGGVFLKKRARSPTAMA